MVTVSGAAPPFLSSVATKNAGTGAGSGASLVLRQHPAGGVEVAADEAALQDRALHVVTALAGREEAVPDQVAGADLDA